MGDARDAASGEELAARLEEQGDPQAYILDRTRSEVHLLLDNLSARPEQLIGALSSQAGEAGLEPTWLEDVCRITWPPSSAASGGRDLARQAALLIRVKDYLNSLAKPASGATIAFTLMVTQERRDDDAAGNGPSRSSLACEAHPDLLHKARGFRRWVSAMALALMIILAMTCLLSWYVAIGNAAVGDATAARAALSEAEKRVTDAQAAFYAAADARSGGTAGAEPGGEQQRTDIDHIFTGNYCHEAAKAGLYPSAELMNGCEALRESEEALTRIEQGLDRWAGPWGDENTARWSLNVLAGAVLPVLYGFLGAAAAIVRTLSRKIKASLLSPRDLQLSLQQLALGAVIGACIGLFIAAPGSKPGDDLSLLGPVALSSSAISFVAGFGVEQVFQALEALISRLFNIAPAATAAPTPAVPQSRDPRRLLDPPQRD
jgi:hypothetical protein